MNRVIHQGDALEWLALSPVLAGCSIITSMPDISEFPKMNLGEWKHWFTEAARRVLEKCPDNGVTFFYQTDIKRDGVWIDKSYLCQKAAEAAGTELITHKIVCRTLPRTVSFGRPGYTHLIGFSKSIRPEIKKAITDVLPTAGDSTWTRGMGLEACRLAVRFVSEHTDTRTIVDPFCGHGSVLAVANSMGFDAIGVELSRKRAKTAQSLNLSSSSKFDRIVALKSTDR